MRQMDGAKAMWMIEHHKTTNDVPTWQDLVGSNAFFIQVPQCSDGGVYVIGKVSEPPTCSIAEHNEYYKKCRGLAKASATHTNLYRLP